MTFPAFSVGTPHSSGTGSTSRNVAFGATLDAGDGIILLVEYRDAAVTFPGGSWTQPTGGPTTQSNFSFDVFKLVAAGGESSVTLATDSAVVMIVYPVRVPAASWNSSQEIEVTAATFTADPPSETASWGSDDNGWIGTVLSNSGSTYTGFPTGFANDQTTVDSAFDSLNTAMATSDNATATLDPSTFTPTGGSRSIAATVVVRGGVSGTDAAAGAASGSGTAHAPAPAVAPSAGSPAATGAANNPTIQVAALAEAAAASGTANQTSTAAAPPPSTATATGSAHSPAPAVGASAAAGAGTGVAESTTATAATTPATATGTGTAASASSTLGIPAGTGTATGVAAQPATTGTTTPSTASAAGSANDATAETGSFVNADAAPATGTGIAANAAVAVGAAAVPATAGGQAWAASVPGDAIDANPFLVTYTEPGPSTYRELAAASYREPAVLVYQE